MYLNKIVIVPKPINFINLTESVYEILYINTNLLKVFNYLFIRCG